MSKWLGKVGRATANVLTLGGYGRKKEVEREIAVLEARHQKLMLDLSSNRDSFQQSLIELASVKKKGFQLLIRSVRLAASWVDIAAPEHPQQVVQGAVFAPKKAAPVTMVKASQTLGLLQTSVSSIGAGAATGMTTWALVSAFGSASTGTAISALSGAAANSAALAWLGGGSLAVGGGGMAVGALALTGLVAIPAVAVAVGINRLNDAISKGKLRIKELASAIAACKAAIEALAQTQARAIQVRQLNSEALQKVDRALVEVRKLLLPVPVLSRIWRLLLRLVGRANLSEPEQEALIRLVIACDELSEAIATPVIDLGAAQEAMAALVEQYNLQPRR